MSHCYAPCRSALTLKNRLLFNSFFCNFAKKKNMISNSPEYLIEEVMNQYGIEVPMETVLTYLDSDPYLTPETLYDYVSRCEQDSKTSVILKGYKFVDFEKDEIALYPGVYIWILKDNAELPSIEGFSPQFSLVEINGHKFRVLYVGQAKTESLYDRIVKNHLKGNPRQSTLCWSIAAIMGMPYTITDKRKPKLDNIHCQQIRKWLLENCHLLYKVVKNINFIDDEEVKQILTFTPPLNLDHNPLKKADPFIQSVSKYRHIEGGYKKAHSVQLQLSKILPYILIAVSILAILYFALK